MLRLLGNRDLGAAPRQAGAVPDDCLDEQISLAGGPLEPAPDGRRARQAWGCWKPVFGLLGLAALAASWAMQAAPRGQGFRSQGKGAVLKTVEHRGTGCENWQDILSGELNSTSPSECAVACRLQPGCTGFGYQESCEPAGLCRLWSGNCTHRENSCMAHHVMVSPTPIAATVEHRSTGCENWRDIQFGLVGLHSVSVGECAAACQEKPGCTGFGYQESCDPARLCKLWSGNCTHRENSCMAQHVMVSPTPMAATVEHPNTGCDNWDDIGLGSLHSVSLEECSASCQKTPGCKGFGYQKSCDGAKLCHLRGSNCTHVNNGCWAQYDVVAPKPSRFTRGPTLATCNTRSADTSVTLKGVGGGKHVENVCAGAEWTGFNTKVQKHGGGLGEGLPVGRPGCQRHSLSRHG
ncbi:unnamed protein product [Prorocentrum cordatum]|uniref:Apple domain-containing protein n=1 Tax=Prorocentrum cordatum TaxID=2364126 RepID=A0ABN9XRM5_9DINO|nr:unnamed protein product [Polarella glacialis]